MTARVRIAVTLRALCDVPAEALTMSDADVRARLMPQLAHLAVVVVAHDVAEPLGAVALALRAERG